MNTRYKIFFVVGQLMMFACGFINQWLWETISHNRYDTGPFILNVLGGAGFIMSIYAFMKLAGYYRNNNRRMTVMSYIFAVVQLLIPTALTYWFMMHFKLNSNGMTAATCLTAFGLVIALLFWFSSEKSVPLNPRLVSSSFRLYRLAFFALLLISVLCLLLFIFIPDSRMDMVMLIFVFGLGIIVSNRAMVNEKKKINCS